MINDLGANVTVITAFYNARKFLRDTVRSVVAQTLQPNEIILVDDCSTDGSGDLANELGTEFGNIRVLRHDKNLGFPSALNTGISEAATEYVAIIDADDLAVPEWLETALRVLTADPEVGAVGGGCIIMTDTGEVTGKKWLCEQAGDVTDAILAGDYRILHPGTVYRRSKLLAVGGYHPALRSAQDSDMFLGIAAVSKVIHVGIPLVYYRRLRVSGSRKTPEYKKMVGAMLDAKAKHLREGVAILEANIKIAHLLEGLDTLPRLKEVPNGAYEYQMARAFHEGQKPVRAIRWYVRAFLAGQPFYLIIRGVVLVVMPKKLARWVRAVRNPSWQQDV